MVEIYAQINRFAELQYFKILEYNSYVNANICSKVEQYAEMIIGQGLCIFRSRSATLNLRSPELASIFKVMDR